MKLVDKIATAVIVAILFLLIINNVRIHQRPTRAEVITICEELIEADTLSIFSKNYQTFIESYTLVQALVLKGDLPVEELQPYIDWLVERNEMRIEEKNEKFND